MNILIHILRQGLALGLIVVVPLFAVMLMNMGKDPEVEVPVLLMCLAHFGLVYFLWVTWPKKLHKKLQSAVAKFKSAGFSPTYEAESVLYNRYVGFDTTSRKALYVDLLGTKETLLDFDSFDYWHLEENAKQPVLLKLLTTSSTTPEISLRIPRADLTKWKSNMNLIFG